MRQTEKMVHNTDKTPHEFRLPRVLDMDVLHQALEDLEGFRGVTRRELVAYATFSGPPPLAVAREIVVRLR